MVKLSFALMLCIAACSNASDPRVDANLHPTIDATVLDGALPDAASAVTGIIVLNEVAAKGDPNDWFEIVNVSNVTLVLSDYIYVDKEGDFSRAKAFPSMELAPAAYYAQDVTTAISGFNLGATDGVWIYRAADHATMDGVNWTTGDSPAGGSYARIPDKTGPFTTVMPATRGLPND